MLKPLIVILGPTASGKTDLAIRLAQKFKGEVVSADSRQIYKEMDVGTAKPRQTRGIPHHLISFIRPRQAFNAARYQKEALKAIQGVLERGRLPFLVGGNGLYLQAVADNLGFPRVAPSPRLRQSLEKKSLAELGRLYRKMDPRGARVIDRKNRRRLIRAIEVCHLSGKPFWSQRKKEKSPFKTLWLGIRPSEAVLRRNISRRTEEMLRLGLEKEARKLFRRYGSRLPSLQTIGYQEWPPFLRGRINSTTRKKIAEEIKNHTWQYAKRQMVWFKRDNRIIWLPQSRLIQRAARLVRSFTAQ
ncbi:MAG: tRNA (adenosine(37)-N6)-dimethylallyltransferase MiaA [Candidatus Nealsonbacteria bacterium]|nr:tRNA (adenosine(37)-N6)-dimethylallyltransferase MiaA [Candidatus Nealsonbacteria bacterium]